MSWDFVFGLVAAMNFFFYPIYIYIYICEPLVIPMPAAIEQHVHARTYVLVANEGTVFL